MKQLENKTYILIGAGNMAKYLLANANAALTCLGIYSRSPEKAALLSQTYGITHISTLIEINTITVDYIFLAVSDTAIPTLLNSIDSSALCVSFSGMIDEQHLAKETEKSMATLWPIYSITNKLNSKTNLPFVINKEDVKNKSAMSALARYYTTSVMELSYEQRKAAHLVAVVLNNFVNHLYALTQELCATQGIDPLIFNPLVQQTADQYASLQAALLQTGPAKRGDQESIEKHLAILQNTHLESIYTLLTDSIKKSS
jgi:predicted short-subunit dehydrogenase-like oxidoreductase (DUF2520 family)